MKLNAGCGHNYIDGWVNIDINPSLKTDAIMSIHDLDFKDEIFDEIRAIHVIEHIGFFKSKYFLSEAYRTLCDGGILILETPHIEKSFENFINAQSPSEREIILGWIYGSESKWNNHLYCFPVELLESLLKEAGFEINKKEFYDYQPLRPAVRMIAYKRKSPEKDRLCLIRKKALKSGEIDFTDEQAMHKMELSFV